MKIEEYKEFLNNHGDRKYVETVYRVTYGLGKDFVDITGHSDYQFATNGTWAVVYLE